MEGDRPVHLVGCCELRLVGPRWISLIHCLDLVPWHSGTTLESVGVRPSSSAELGAASVAVSLFFLPFRRGFLEPGEGLMLSSEEAKVDHADLFRESSDLHLGHRTVNPIGCFDHPRTGCKFHDILHAIADFRALCRIASQVSENTERAPAHACHGLAKLFLEFGQVGLAPEPPCGEPDDTQRAINGHFAS